MLFPCYAPRQRGSGTAGLSAIAVAVLFGGAFLPLSLAFTSEMLVSASENKATLIDAPFD
jgi:hypothetical protein